MNVEEYLKETRTEATARHTILITVVMIVIPVLAYIYVIYLLIKNLLFDKSKLVRIFSALGLAAIAVGTIVCIRYILKDNYTKVVAYQPKNDDNANNDSKNEPQLHSQHQNMNEQTSVHESVERNSKDIETHPVSTENSIPIPVIKNSDGVYDWQSMCQKEWPKSFLEVQRALSVFGGFQLAQPPIDGLELDEDHNFIHHVQLMIQKDIPLQKKYRYFQKADLKFFHGALIEFTLKAHFPKKYSKASIDREYKALEDDVVEILKPLNKPELGIEYGGEVYPRINHIRMVKFGLSANPSTHKIVGAIYTDCKLQPDDEGDGYDLELSVFVHNEYTSYILPSYGLIEFIKLVTEKEAYEAGEDLESIGKKQQSSDDSTYAHQSSTQARKSDERKAEDTETRPARTETPVPLPTISTQSEKETLPNHPEESTDPQPQKTVDRQNPHFEAARKHDWQSMCQKEWSKSFLEIQDAFSVFGGFKLAQPPIDGIKFDTKDVQKDVPLQTEYRYFKKADLEFFNGALVGFTLKAHFAKTYSKASVERECKAFEDDVVKNLNRLKRPGLGIGLGSTFPSHPWDVEYGQSRSPSTHKIVGTIIVSYDLNQDEEGYDLTLSVDAQRGMRQLIELALEKEADETGDELEAFDKKQPTKGKAPHRDETSQSSTERTSKTVTITGFSIHKFGQKYLAARMTPEMWQEGGLAIKPVKINYRKFRTLELGYAIEGKKLCRMKLCAEFPSNADDKQLSDELMKVKGEIERQFGLEMTGSENEANYEDEKYVVKLWRQQTTKTVYNTRHVGFRKQRTANTMNIKCLYLLLEDKSLMPK